MNAMKLVSFINTPKIEKEMASDQFHTLDMFSNFLNVCHFVQEADLCLKHINIIHDVCS